MPSKMTNETPSIITINKIGKPDMGYISFIEGKSDQLPFEIKRVFWTYYTPESVIRGGHAHQSTMQAIIAVSGKIIFEIKDQHDYHQIFTLEFPNQILIIPTMFWSDIKFSHNAVLLCLASEVYNESEYIRDFEVYKKLKK
jgi:dTDP-4-dehydrorhamnose 3,5-epimerase-like enzyme